MNNKTVYIVPKIVGIETEYGIVRHNGRLPAQVAQDLFVASIKKPILWDYQAESPVQDARGMLFSAPIKSEEPTSGPASEKFPPDFTGNKEARKDGVNISVIRDLSTVLENGGRYYVDHAHPEYSSPECVTARQAVAYDKAGENIMMQFTENYNQQCQPDERISVYKNNTDFHGHSYGCHENYLIDTRTYQMLFNDRAHWLYHYLLPYFVSRQILCGAGKVGIENHSNQVEFQLSQRADFFECVLGLQTTYHRPIINTRDEPHANPDQYRRLHVICGDSNLAEWSIYLKIGPTQLILAMLESGALNFKQDLTLGTPVQAFREISQDPSLRVRVQLETGQRKFTAIEIQRVFLDAARHFLDHNREAARQWDAIWTDWSDAIQALDELPESMDTRLDWRIKLKFLREQLQRKQASWQHPMAREMDIKYHLLDQKAGFFFLLRQAGFVDNLLEPREVLDAMQIPPAQTRAWLRGLLVRQYSHHILSVNWDVLRFQNLGKKSVHNLLLSMPDPMQYAQKQTESILNNDDNLEDILTHLQQMDFKRGDSWDL